MYCGIRRFVHPIIRTALALSAVLALVGFETACHRGPAQPTSPPPPDVTTPPPPPPPPASVELSVSGRVVDNVYRPLAEARVEVVEGSGAGAVSITSGSGEYELPGVFSGPIAVRASKVGYVAQMQSVTLHPIPSGRHQLGFILDRPSESLAGAYTVIVDADPACSELPPAAHRRTYEASATPASVSNTYRVSLSGARFSASRGSMFALVSGNSVRFDIDPYSDMIVTEELTPSTTLSFWGSSAVGDIGPSISVPLEGEFEYCPDARGAQATFPYVVCGVPPVHCSSSRHMLSVVRR
jgi:hypothetical protein